MRLTINGTEVAGNFQDGINIVVDVKEGGESIGPVRITFTDQLSVRGNLNQAEAVLIDGPLDKQPYLSLERVGFGEGHLVSLAKLASEMNRESD